MWAYIRLGRLRSTRKSQEVIGLVGAWAGTCEVAGGTLDASKRSCDKAVLNSALVHSFWFPTQSPSPGIQKVNLIEAPDVREAARPFWGIAVGAMNYPLQFPKEARAQVEAERIRAGRALDEARAQEPPVEWKKGKRAWDQCAFYAFVLRVFGAFAHEACELGRRGGWTVDSVRSAASDFLASFAFDQYYEQGHDRFGEKFPDITNHWTGTLSFEVERSLQQSSVWRQFEDELLAVAEQQSAPVVTGSGQAAEAFVSALPDMEGSTAESIPDRGRQAEVVTSISPTQIANPHRNPNASSAKIALLADATLESELISYWRQFRSDPVMWERGNQEEKESGLAFPPCLVAYDLVPIFVKWALRVCSLKNEPAALAELLLAQICPDEEYAEWAESSDRAEEREARLERAEGGATLRPNVGPRRFGAWERAVQGSWERTKNMMGKYESCAACRAYDSYQNLSPATRALRLLAEFQPVQEDLKRQLNAAIVEREHIDLAPQSNLPSWRRNEAQQGFDVAEAHGIPASTPDRGNVEILKGTDGNLKKAVTLDVARRFGGVTMRAIQDAAKSGKLETEGRRLQRRVLVQSLLKYFPPET